MTNKGIKQASKGVVSKGTLAIRIYYRDYIKLRQLIKPTKNESACSWFERVREFIDDRA